MDVRGQFYWRDRLYILAIFDINENVPITSCVYFSTWSSHNAYCIVGTKRSVCVTLWGHYLLSPFPCFKSVPRYIWSIDGRQQFTSRVKKANNSSSAKSLKQFVRLGCLRALEIPYFSNLHQVKWIFLFY